MVDTERPWAGPLGLPDYVREWSPLTDDEFEAQSAAQVELAEAAEFWDDEEEASSALYRQRRKLSDYLLTARDLDKIPPVSWLVEGVIPEDAIAVLYAAPGAGKTFVALDWCCHLASGRPAWEGRTLRPDTRVLYIYAEGAPGLRKRRDAWEKHHGTQVNGNLWFIIRAANFLARESLGSGGPDGEDDWSQLRMICNTVKPHLVVVDTMSRALPGADENDQSVMSALIDRVDQLREASGWATVLFVHHTNAAGTRERGSSVVKGAANTMIHLGDDMVLLVSKQKDDQEPVLGKVTLEPVEGTDSVVPVYAAVDEDGPDNDAVRRRVVLETVKQHPGKTASAIHEMTGGGKGKVTETLKELDEQGHIRTETAGRSVAYYLAEARAT